MATELNLDKFVDKIIANAEGTYAHTDSANIPTEAYGLTAAATKDFKPAKGSNESDRDFAKRVLKDKYVKEVKKKLGDDAWNKMPESMKAVAVDVHYNAGLGSNPSFVKSLKDGDYPAALKNTLDIVGVTKDGTQYTSSGLAKRRASIYNVGAAGLGLPLITDTLATKKDGDSKTQVSYFVGDGKDVLLSLDLNKPLATDSTEGWKNPVDYGFKESTTVSPTRLTPQQMEQAVIKKGMQLTPEELRNYQAERDIRNYSGMEPGIQKAMAMQEPQYMSMEELLMDKDLMRNPLLFDDATAEKMWRQF